MALARAYKVGVFDTATPTFTGGTVAGVTTPVPILAGLTVSPVDCNVSAIRCGVIGAAAFPSNASAIFSLIQVIGTAGGGTAATAIQLSGVARAANTTYLTAGGSGAAAITGTSITSSSKIMWSQEIPFTAGSSYGDWVTPGFEINMPISTSFGVYVTTSSAGTSTTFSCEIEFTE
jgi:hypothetical protein